MRFCSNCGTKNENDAKFCSACGTMLEAAQAEETTAAAETPAPEAEAAPAAEAAPVQESAPAPAPAPIPTPAPQTNYQPYQVQAAPGISAKGRTFGIIGFVLGIISTAFCWLGIIPVGGIVAGFFMIASGIVGLIFCNISKREGEFKLARVGKVFAIIGICLSGVFWIIGFIVSAAYITTVESYNNYGNYGNYNLYDYFN